MFKIQSRTQIIRTKENCMLEKWESANPWSGICQEYGWCSVFILQIISWGHKKKHQHFKMHHNKTHKTSYVE